MSAFAQAKALVYKESGPQCGPQQFYYIRRFSLVSTLSSVFLYESVFYTTLQQEFHAVWLLESGNRYVIL